MAKLPAAQAYLPAVQADNTLSQSELLEQVPPTSTEPVFAVGDGVGALMTSLTSRDGGDGTDGAHQWVPSYVLPAEVV